MKTRVRSKQFELDIRSWGGERRGAGRKRTKTSLQRHEKRPEIKSSLPAHVTLTFDRRLDSIRHKRGIAAFAKAAKGAQKWGLKIVHFSLQADHAHMIVEARKNRDLSKGLQSFSISMAKTLNRFFDRSGKVFRDRYHMRVLKTPSEVRNAIRYALFNRAKHLKMSAFVDRFSSVAYVGKREVKAFASALEVSLPVPVWLGSRHSEIEGALSEPGSWLLRQGWRA
jgi:putative transposase